jgi:hypothetical protein
MTAVEASTWATFAATVATAAATMVLAWFTWVMAKASKQMADAAREALVVATIDVSRNSSMHVELVIENSGAGPAYDVRVNFAPPIVRRKGASESELPLNRISVLRSQQRIVNFIGEFGGFKGTKYTVTISWRSTPDSKNRIASQYEFDLDHYAGVHILGQDPAVALANEVKKLRERMDRIGGTSKLKVDVFSQRDRDREAEEQEKWLQEAELVLDAHKPQQNDGPGTSGAD